MAAQMSINTEYMQTSFVELVHYSSSVVLRTSFSLDHISWSMIEKGDIWGIEKRNWKSGKML
jgi:hypothetical protein